MQIDSSNYISEVDSLHCFLRLTRFSRQKKIANTHLPKMILMGGFTLLILVYGLLTFKLLNLTKNFQ